MNWSRGGQASHAQRAADLTRQLTAERSDSARMRLEKEHHASLAQRALADAAKSREAREDVRRVLAAAIANEKRAAEEVEHARGETTRLMSEAKQSERMRGESEGKLRALELRLVEDRQSTEKEVREAHDRSWALSAEHGRAMQQIIAEREEARAELRTLISQVPEATRSAYARSLLALAAVCLLLASLLIPGLIGRLAGDERAYSLDLFTGLGDKTPLVIFALLCLASMGLMAWGLALLRKPRLPLAPQSLAAQLPAAIEKDPVST